MVHPTRGMATIAWRRLAVRGPRQAAAKRWLSSPRLIYEDEAVIVKSLPVTPFQMNQYLLGCKTTGDGAIVDAGDDAVARWMAAAAEHGLEVKHLIQTHGHVDHVSGLAAFKRELPDAPIYLHPLDAVIMKAAPAQGMSFGMTGIEDPPPADVDVDDGDVLKVGNLELTAMHTPGHAPGHLIFHLASAGVRRQELLSVELAPEFAENVDTRRHRLASSSGVTSSSRGPSAGRTFQAATKRTCSRP